MIESRTAGSLPAEHCVSTLADSISRLDRIHWHPRNMMHCNSDRLFLLKQLLVRLRETKYVY